MMGALADRLRGRKARKELGRLTSLGARAHGSDIPELPCAPGAFHVNDGPHYHDVLREVHRVLRPDWYLEVGTRNGQSLALADCNVVAIDPAFERFTLQLIPGKRAHFLSETSDDAFASGFLARQGIRPDFGFLDGMHLSDFLMRDLINFERAARPGAAVALHDCLPFSHAMETRDDSVIRTGEPWTGDVWKVLWWLTQHRPDLRINVLDAWRTGLVIVEGMDPASTVLADTYDGFIAEMRDIRLQEFGVDRFFAAFHIQSAFLYVEDLRSRTATS